MKLLTLSRPVCVCVCVLSTMQLFDHKLLSAMTCLLHFPHWSGQIKNSTTLPTNLSIPLAYIWDLRHFLIFYSTTHLSTWWWIIKCLFGEKGHPSLPLTLYFMLKCKKCKNSPQKNKKQDKYGCIFIYKSFIKSSDFGCELSSHVVLVLWIRRVRSS